MHSIFEQSEMEAAVRRERMQVLFGQSGAPMLADFLQHHVLDCADPDLAVAHDSVTDPCKGGSSAMYICL